MSGSLGPLMNIPIPWARLLILTIGTFQNSFSNTFLLFLVPLRLIGSHPQRQPSASGSILIFGVRIQVVDAFSISWLGENNWMMPLVYLFSCTILHLEVCRAHGILIVPRWPLAAFWPIVFPIEGLRASVRQVIEFPDPSFNFGSYAWFARELVPRIRRRVGIFPRSESLTDQKQHNSLKLSQRITFYLQCLSRDINIKIQFILLITCIRNAQLYNELQTFYS